MILFHRSLSFFLTHTFLIKIPRRNWTADIRKLFEPFPLLFYCNEKKSNVKPNNMHARLYMPAARFHLQLPKTQISTSKKVSVLFFCCLLPPMRYFFYWLSPSFRKAQSRSFFEATGDFVFVEKSPNTLLKTRCHFW